MIHAICFDLDGLVFKAQSFTTFKTHIAGFCRFPKLIDLVFHGPEMVAFKLNELGESEFWEYARDTLGTALTNDEFYAILTDSYSIDYQVLDFIMKAKENGYQTCTCSNNFVSRIRELDHAFGFLNHFDTALFSFDVGALKPAVAIYQALVAQCQLEPSQIVCSDDNDSKLEGAKILGINTFVYENFQQFSRELELLGVSLD